MTPLEHYQEAERLLAESQEAWRSLDFTTEAKLLVRAQVHATLAIGRLEGNTQ